ncbi:uncharacterized protein LOC133895240 [Phragmites australis]|uniref:uncharacterized protein LOC133895240 n=1 Tax=Phragmites australis TaxID=29695 RepID=UPI002D78B821|nr:uncharacterized protein LOC133895240 [Phragmites australis]
MDSDAGEPFYVIRIYLSECQAQVSNSTLLLLTVFKGHSLPKDTEEYLAARGLGNALSSIQATDARDELFGDLVPCPFQQPDGTASSTSKRSQEIETSPAKKHPKVAEQEPLPDSHLSCILEFDGASKGNPRRAGAGAIIRQLDGSLIAQLREGLGIATNNASEYGALEGFKYIRARGDSKVICNQVSDLYRNIRSDSYLDFWEEIESDLKISFRRFQLKLGQD